MQHLRTLWLPIVLLILGIIAVASPTKPDHINACLWDDDTLRAEAQGLPGLAEVITGHFDRFPPKYYEMRLDRVTNEVESDPTNLDHYDNAGVACDRLGRSDDAIEWMSRKRIALDALETPDPEHEYRYLANLGTFHVHRWLSAGADRAEMADVERARDLIAQAIKLNPDAHFGREQYQLRAIEWILSLDEKVVPPTFISINHGSEDEPYYEEDPASFWRSSLGDREELIEGLSGLIVLGNAWESVDVYNALRFALYYEQYAVIAYLAELRIDELRKQGRRSLLPENQHNKAFRMISSDVLQTNVIADTERYFREARAQAKERESAFNAYVIERLDRGEHPDTHPDFFAQWTPTNYAPPPIPGRAWYNTIAFRIGFALVLLVGLFGCVLLVLIKLTKLIIHRATTPSGS